MSNSPVICSVGVVEPLEKSEVISEKVIDNAPTLSTIGMKTPCILKDINIIEFIDPGTTHSLINKKCIMKYGLDITPKNEIIKQCISGSNISKIGIVENFLLENGTKSIRVDLEVGDIIDYEELLIGFDLFQFWVMLLMPYSIQDSLNNFIHQKHLKLNQLYLTDHSKLMKMVFTKVER